MHGAVLVQHGHLVGREQLLRHQRRGNFHAILPEGHVLRLQRVLRILEGLAQAQHTFDLDGIVRQELTIGRQVIAGNRDNRLQLGRLHALLLAVAADDGLGRDRAGVLSEFVPAGLRAGHVQIDGDFQHLVRDGLGEHALQSGQQVLSVAEKGLNGRNLIHCAGKIQLWEQALHLCLRHAAVQQGLHLHQQRDVFRHRALVHGGGDLVQLLQNAGLFAFIGGAVFPQLLRQRVDVRRRALNVLLLPHRHDNGGQRLSVLLRRGQTVAVVLGVQLIQRLLLFGFIGNQLYEGEFLVVLLRQLGIDRTHALGGGFHGIFINGHIRVRLSRSLRAGDFRLQLLPNLLKTVRISSRQVVFDLNGLAGVDQLLKAHLIFFSEQFGLPLFQQAADLRVHGVQFVDVAGKLVGHGGIARRLSGFAHFLQLAAGGGGQLLEGVRPFPDDLVGFLFAVRPDGQHALQPFAGASRLAGKAAGIQPEEGKPFGLAVERVGGGILPLAGRVLHALQGLAGLLRAGNVVSQRDGRRNDSSRHGNPCRRRFAQHGKKALPAAARLGHGQREFSDAGGHRAHALDDLREHQNCRASCRGNGGEFDNHQPLAFVQRHEFLDQVGCAVDQPLYRGIQIVADTLSRQHGGILEIFQLALRGGVALARLVGQGHIVLPRRRGRLLGFGEKLRRVGGAHQGIPQAHLGKAHLLQGDDGGHALLVHLGQANDEFLNRTCRIGVPQRLEFLGGQSGYPGEVLQGFAVGLHGHLHFDHGLAERRAARLGLEPHRGQRRGEAQNLRLR